MQCGWFLPEIQIQTLANCSVPVVPDDQSPFVLEGGLGGHSQPIASGITTKHSLSPENRWRQVPRNAQHCFSAL